MKTKQQIINEKIEELRETFNEETIFQTDNFEDREGIGHHCYSHYGIAKAFEDFLSQSLSEAIDETIEEMKEKELEFLKRIELEINTVVCECGEKWSKTDMADLIKNRIDQQEELIKSFKEGK